MKEKKNPFTTCRKALSLINVVNTSQVTFCQVQRKEKGFLEQITVVINSPTQPRSPLLQVFSNEHALQC